jgi:tumor protein p53-inducible protein 3
MKALQFDQAGGPENLYFTEFPDLQPRPHELLVHVHATALNRADLLQRQGKYPPPPGASPLLGLEMAGTVIGWGEAVTGFSIGDPVCGLLPGGGYAQQVVIPATLALRLPESISFTKAAAVPEVFLTAYQALRWLAEVKAGDRLLIHAGGSGVGTAAIQLARWLGVEQVFVTASPGKHAMCLSLGADHAIDYRRENFAEVITELTDGKGVNSIIDFIGAPYFADNLRSLQTDGTLVLLAFMGGHKVPELSLATLMRKRLSIRASTLRSRDLAYKTKLTAAFRQECWPLFASGELQPVIDSIYPWEEVAAAHQYLAGNHNTGKVVMTVGQ